MEHTNAIFNSFFGIWVCDKNGLYFNIHSHDNYIGVILCKVPAGNFAMPGGAMIGGPQVDITLDPCY